MQKAYPCEVWFRKNDGSSAAVVEGDEQDCRYANRLTRVPRGCLCKSPANHKAAVVTVVTICWNRPVGMNVE